MGNILPKSGEPDPPVYWSCVYGTVLGKSYLDLLIAVADSISIHYQGEKIFEITYLPGADPQTLEKMGSYFFGHPYDNIEINLNPYFKINPSQNVVEKREGVMELNNKDDVVNILDEIDFVYVEDNRIRVCHSHDRYILYSAIVDQEDISHDNLEEDYYSLRNLQRMLSQENRIYDNPIGIHMV